LLFGFFEDRRGYPQSEYGRARQRALDYALGLVKTLEADIEADNLRAMGESINIPEPEDEEDKLRPAS
jgi:hypothetical protein